MNDKFQILRDFAKSNDKPSKDIYQFVKEILDMNSAYAKENQQLKIQISAREEEYKKLEDNWDKLKEYIDVKLYNTEYLQKLCGCRTDGVEHLILEIIKNKMQELERGNSNE